MQTGPDFYLHYWDREKFIVLYYMLFSVFVSVYSWLLNDESLSLKLHWFDLLYNKYTTNSQQIEPVDYEQD